MQRRRRSDRFVEPLVVTVEDGTRFRCSVAALGREAEPRWALLDSRGVQYIGPPVEADKSREGIERLINAWWKERNASGGTEHSEPPDAAGVRDAS